MADNDAKTEKGVLLEERKNKKTARHYTLPSTVFEKGNLAKMTKPTLKLKKSNVLSQETTSILL